MEKIDHRSYPAYKDTKGSYQFKDFVLSIDRVQGDPFASPSDVSIHIASSMASFPSIYYTEDHRRIALEDLICRTFAKEASRFSFEAKGSGKSGIIQTSRPPQEILERSATKILDDGGVVMRFNIGFPAYGRTINSGELKKILFEYLPILARRALYFKSFPPATMEQTLNLADDQRYIRSELKKRGLVAFVADGSILPRESGVSSRPLKSAVPFVSPDTLAVTLDLPHRGKIRGMGIKKGITMITGGGFHGKSTLLRALELGVYNHIAGDGREYVITDESAVKLRAEDGRSVTGTDISMFIRNLPGGKNTACFSTQDASGSTSQAANVIEAMEAGSTLFLIDEDTSATNFMIRDELMQCVVLPQSEPIIPFIDRVGELYESFGISTILVAGSCGAYFHKADSIIQMKDYSPLDITLRAKKIADRFPIKKESPESAEPANFDERFLVTTKRLSDRVKIKTFGLDGISVDREDIDLRYVEQLIDPEQLNLLGQIMKYSIARLMDGRYTAVQMVDRIEEELKRNGMEGICGGEYVPRGYARPRRQEIAACLNRYRKERVKGRGNNITNLRPQ